MDNPPLGLPTIQARPCYSYHISEDTHTSTSTPQTQQRYLSHQLPEQSPQFGWLLGEKIGPIQGEIFSAFQREEAKIPLTSATLLPPTTPNKIVCVGRNYAAHAKEHGAEVPSVPLIFLKPPTALIGHQQNIILPPQSQQVEHEHESDSDQHDTGTDFNQADVLSEALERSQKPMKKQA